MSHALVELNFSHDVVELPRERRTGWRVQDHWSRVKAEGDDVPSLADLDLGRNAELEDVSFLLREDEMVEQSVFVLCGDAVRMAFPANPLALTLGEAIPREIIGKIKQTIQRARTEGRPVACEGDYRRRDGCEMRFRSVFMPARSMRSTPDGAGYIFGTFGQRKFSTLAA